ncbi:MAG: AraC family transcriptional regulator [Planctomycetota bacterium]|nr:MAG: AraC family transcriptional regulator [Planctomycetota bacterium]
MDKKTKVSPRSSGVYESLRERWDKGVWHFEHVPRRFPGPPPVVAIGWVPSKRQRVQHSFSTVNFSLVLAGQGEYVAAGAAPQSITRPTLIRQYPGPIFAYGPQQQWCELFVIYGPHTLPAWQERGATLADSWGIPTTPRMYRLLDELLELCRTATPFQDVDRIDRLAEWLVVESLHHEPEAVDWRMAVVARLRAEVERDPVGEWDVVAAATAAGLSVSHFRRLWQAAVGMPPLRYRRILRLQQACQALLRDDRPIARIAGACGFHDQLYFARCFRSFTGMSASAYRQRFRDAAP